MTETTQVSFLTIYCISQFIRLSEALDAPLTAKGLKEEIVVFTLYVIALTTTNNSIFRNKRLTTYDKIIPVCEVPNSC